ncbi:restriction endonuclease subunit S [Salmonella enterica]|nr:restriction endonuclease subunit S [Salmonella enterica]EAB5863323.1 restriction endonuclease subunit S [Salmonella enterica subsp. enterica serovar Cairina]EBY6261127.1 restriction endonuclease subunit S [Salmonella enterica subsp. enterica serovar Warnow]EBZ4429190.1 restriction endonuclease subunit S [Salmonella enterica subsp. enterica serovar Derby]EDT2937437.1 restriction endonuclease subunit S [Salmonella enterica subsp. enterica]EAM8673673.1 restriction endonuclease subunit S [Salmo
MSGGKLPEEWVKTTIGVICEVKGGKRLPKGKALLNTATEHPYIRVTDFENGSVNLSTIKYLDSDTYSAISNYTISKNDLYISIAGTIGLIGEIPEQLDNANLTENAAKLCFILGTDKKYLKHVLSSNKTIEQFDDKTTSSGQPKLALFRIRDCEFPYAPINEQKIIAEKLDTLLAQVDSTKARLEQIPQILKRFRQAVLASAVSGKLTLAWRENNEVSESAKELLIRWTNSREQKFTTTQKILLASKKIKKIKTFPAPTPADLVTGEELIIPINWEIVSVSQIADCLDSQRVPVKKEYRTTSEGIYPYFGANGEVDRVDNFIFDGDFVLVTEDETFYGRTKPIAYRFTGKCWVNNHVHILSAPTKAANDYLCYALMYYKIIPWLTGTTGRAKLTQGALNSLPIGLPPEEEINEIVRRVEQLFAYADTIEKQVNNALTRVNSLTQSILAKAFRGELTAQWRAENPELISGENSAAALLEKIKAERAASGGKKTSRKKA